MRFSILLLFCFLFLCGSSRAQLTSIDIGLIKNKAEIQTYNKKKKIRTYTPLNKSQNKSFIHKMNPINITFSSLLFVYQNVISSQINASCIYNPSCSEFSKKCIKEYGLVKGLFLTADRLQRCTRISAFDITDFSNPRVSDPISQYKHIHEYH